MERVSITDLKNGLSARMNRVRAGETLLVTDRSKPVAVLSPLAGPMRTERMEGLILRGVIAPPGRSLDVGAFLSLRRATGSAERTLSGAVDEDREGR